MVGRLYSCYVWWVGNKQRGIHFGLSNSSIRFFGYLNGSSGGSLVGRELYRIGEDRTLFMMKEKETDTLGKIYRLHSIWEKTWNKKPTIITVFFIHLPLIFIEKWKYEFLDIHFEYPLRLGNLDELFRLGGKRYPNINIFKDKQEMSFTHMDVAEEITDYFYLAELLINILDIGTHLEKENKDLLKELIFEVQEKLEGHE